MRKQLLILTLTGLFFLNTYGQAISSKEINSLNSGLYDLATQISEGLTENQKQKIAVVEFVDLEGKVSNFGRYLAEELITRLYQTKKFKVIERNLLTKIINEQKLTLTGIIEPTAAQKLGKLLGVDAVASGSVSDLGKTFKVNARLMNAETGEIFAVASTEVIKDDSVCNLIGGCNSIAQASSLERAANETNLIQPKHLKAVGKNFTFELIKCVRKNISVTCDLTVTNNNEERQFYTNAGFYTSTRVFDDANNEHRATWMQLANRGKRIEGDYINMVTNIPATLQLGFENFSETTKKLTLLEISFRDGRDFNKVKFQDINLIVE